MGVVRGEARKAERARATPWWRQVAFLLFLFLTLLTHECEGLVIPCAFGWSHPRVESVARHPRSWLSAVKTKSPSADVGYITVEAPPLLAEISRDTVTTTMSSDAGSADDAEEREEAWSDTEDSSTGTQEAPVDDDEEILKRRSAAAAAALLRRNRGVSRSQKPQKSTSVGARKVGSATRARRAQGRTSKLMDTVRTVASAAAASSQNTNTTASEPKGNSTSRVNIGNNVIQSTISNILNDQDAMKEKLDDNNELSMNFQHGPIGIPVLGERPDPLSHELLKKPVAGTMLIYPTLEVQRATRPSRETLSVRVATPDDDVHIASLRLSVFSDFSPYMRDQFCARSCQVLADRRLRGATCLVATFPSGTASKDIILGSVECSVHEFYATKLGQRRPKYSVLYITEVAVSPASRRCGIGSKLLQGVDELASLRKVESLYLHVDVSNFGALELYRKAGYRKVNHGDSMYSEFTTSLNLHDGATKGRRHYLLCKDLTRDPTWLSVQEECSRGHNLSNIDTATWGFGITVN